jgi:hypothetical protein
MPASLDDLFGQIARGPVEVHPPMAGKPVYFRSPTYDEWYELAVAHRALDGRDPPKELITKTVAVVLANHDGSRKLSASEASVLLKADSQLVMWLYVKAWETVLRSDEKVASDAEKN